MGDEEREPLLSARAANGLTSPASGVDDVATGVDKKAGARCLRRREKQHG